MAFHSHKKLPEMVDHPCKFIGTKGSFYIRKEFNSHWIGLGHQHGRRFIGTPIRAAVSSWENDLLFHPQSKIYEFPSIYVTAIISPPFHSYLSCVNNCDGHPFICSFIQSSNILISLVSLPQEKVS